MSAFGDFTADVSMPPASGLDRRSGLPGALAACTEQRWKLFAAALCLLLVSRLLAEIINTFAWDTANYLWSLLALPVIAALLWPWLMIWTRGERLVARYFPVIAYLAFMAARTRWDHAYSLKCFFAEVIVWCCFVFTAETCARSNAAAGMIQAWLLRAIKLIVLLGVVQLVLGVALGGGVSLGALLEMRPVHGIFVHQNLFLVIVFPFLFYFLKQRDWLWCLLVALCCIGTGTRSPLLAAVCLTPVIGRSLLRRPVTWRDLALTLLIIAAAYTALIAANLGAWEYDDDGRTNLSTLQWRIAYWENFLQDGGQAAFWLGHGVGAADNIVALGGETGILPHNDYLRAYYDLGVVGLGATLGLVLFMICWTQRSSTVQTDFIIVAYLLVACFRVTDNFMYITASLWTYMFIASHAAPAADPREEAM